MSDRRLQDLERFITVDVNDPAVIDVVDKAIELAWMLPKRKRANAVLAELRRYSEGPMMRRGEA